MVSARGQVDVLDVPVHLTIENSADKKSNRFIKASFVVLGFNDGALVGEVVSHHLAPGSFVAAFENILKLGQSLLPVPVQLGSCLNEVWKSLLVKELHPKGSAVQVDFSFPGPTRKLEFFQELCAIIPWPFG